MKDPTISEISRKLDDHLKSEDSYQERFENKLDQILLQVTKTNGRVSYIETWKEKDAIPILEDYKENRAQAKGAGKLWAFIGTGVVATLILTGTLYIKNLKIEILEEVKALNDK